MVHVNAQSARPRNPAWAKTGGADIGAGASGADLATSEAAVDAGAVTGVDRVSALGSAVFFCRLPNANFLRGTSRPLAASICVFSSLTSWISRGAR